MPIENKRYIQLSPIKRQHKSKATSIERKVWIDDFWFIKSNEKETKSKNSNGILLPNPRLYPRVDESYKFLNSIVSQDTDVKNFEYAFEKSLILNRNQNRRSRFSKSTMEPTPSFRISMNDNFKSYLNQKDKRLSNLKHIERYVFMIY